MTTDTNQVNFPNNVRTYGMAAQAGHFLRHFLEMCIAMCVGGAILNLMVFAAAPALIGDPNLREQFPELSLLAIAFNFTLPMAAWMRFRGMEWRPILEMSGAAIGLGILLIGLVWLGISPSSTLGASAAWHA